MGHIWPYLYERVKKIREETRRELDGPPDPPSVIRSPADTTGKRLDVATFVTDLLQNFMMC